MDKELKRLQEEKDKAERTYRAALEMFKKAEQRYLKCLEQRFYGGFQIVSSKIAQ